MRLTTRSLTFLLSKAKNIVNVGRVTRLKARFAVFFEFCKLESHRNLNSTFNEQMLILFMKQVMKPF